MFELDTQIFLYLHKWVSVTPGFWHFLAGWFGLIIIAGALTFLSLHKHKDKHILEQLHIHAKEWFVLVWVPLITWIFTGILKVIISRPRPFEILDVAPLSFPGSFDSFPSGHAAFYMAIALAVYKYHKRMGWVFIVLAAVLSLSRIVMGVHYPIDILGGWLVAWLVYKLFTKK